MGAVIWQNKLFVCLFGDWRQPICKLIHITLRSDQIWQRGETLQVCAEVCDSQPVVRVGDVLGTPADQFAKKAKLLCRYAPSALVLPVWRIMNKNRNSATQRNVHCVSFVAFSLAVNSQLQKCPVLLWPPVLPLPQKVKHVSPTVIVTKLNWLNTHYVTIHCGFTHSCCASDR